MEESISLEAMPPVGDIIYTTLDFSSGEVSVSDGTALIRAEAAFKCLYEKEGDEGGLQLATRRFPVVLTVDDECFTADSDVSFDLSAKHIETEKEIDAYGENRVIKLNYGVRAQLNCINRQEIEAPTDMFFEEYETENKLHTLPYEEPSKEMKHRFTLEKVFEIPEMSIDSCLDVNVSVSVSEAAASEDGISVKGNCGINVFGPSADGYRAHDCTAAFSELLPFPVSDSDCRFRISAEAQNAAADISGGRLTVRVPIQLGVIVTHKESLTALASAEIETRTDGDAENKPIIIYYPQKGETAWDIGKRYYVNPDDITVNNADAFDKNGAVAADGVILYM